MGIKQRAITSVKWNTLATVICTVLQLLKLAVLTQLLDKSAFGLIAIASMVISFTEIFSEIGITTGIIHKQNITTNQYSSLFWMNLILSIFMFGLLWLSSPLLSKFYDEPILNIIIPLLGTQIIINAFGKIFQTIKVKNLDFDFISKVKIFTSLLGFGMTVLFAWLGWGVYSLVFGQIIQNLVNQSIYAIEGIKASKIKLHFCFTEVKDFLKIGVYQLGSQILDFVSSKIDVFLIGRFFGMDDLGVYNLAKELIVRPYTIINSLVSSVATSVFAMVQDSIDAVRTYYKKMVNIMSTVAIPIYVILFVFSDLIVSILFAPSFASAAQFVRILSVVGMISSINSLVGVLTVSKGRTDLGFYWTIFRVITQVATIFIASFFTIYAVAYGQAFLSILYLFVYWYMMIRKLAGLRFGEYLSCFTEPLLVSIFSGIPFALLLFNCNMNIVWQIIMGIAYCLLFFGYYYMFRREFIMDLIKMIYHRD